MFALDEWQRGLGLRDQKDGGAAACPEGVREPCLLGYGERKGREAQGGFTGTLQC